MSIEIGGISFNYDTQPQKLLRSSVRIGGKSLSYSRLNIASTSQFLVNHQVSKKQIQSQVSPTINCQFELAQLTDFRPNASSLTRKDETTGVQHPASYSFSSETGPDSVIQLIGTGPREKKLFGLLSLKVYSVGAYLSKESLTKWMKDSNYKNLEASQAMQGIVEGFVYPNMIRIVLTSDKVNRQNFTSSFNESLEPRMIQMEDKEALSSFRNQFAKVNFKKGIEFTIYQLKQGELETYYNGAKLGNIKSKRLCSSFLDLYYGEKTVSPITRSDVKRNIQQIVQAEKQSLMG